MSEGQKDVKKMPNQILQEERLLRRWTQQDVAIRVGTTVVNVSRWERGITSPSPYFRQQLCDLFEKDIEALGLLTVRQNAQEEVPLTQQEVPQEISFAPSQNISNFSPIYNRPFWSVQSGFVSRQQIILTVVAVIAAIIVTGGGLSFYAFLLTQPQHIEQISGPILQIVPPNPLTQSIPPYSFEHGKKDGWSQEGHILSMQVSSDAVGGYQGTHALRLTLNSTKPGDMPFVYVNPDAQLPRAGQVLSMALFVPIGTTPTVQAKLYVQDGTRNYGWHMGETIDLPTGKWFVMKYIIPSGYGPMIQVGVQFTTYPYLVPVTVYIDAISWS